MLINKKGSLVHFSSVVLIEICLQSTKTTTKTKLYAQQQVVNNKSVGGGGRYMHIGVKMRVGITIFLQFNIFDYLMLNQLLCGTSIWTVVCESKKG